MDEYLLKIQEVELDLRTKTDLDRKDLVKEVKARFERNTI